MTPGLPRGKCSPPLPAAGHSREETPLVGWTAAKGLVWEAGSSQATLGLDPCPACFWPWAVEHIRSADCKREAVMASVFRDYREGGTTRWLWVPSTAGAQSRWDGTRGPQGSGSSAQPSGSCAGPVPSLLPGATGRGGWPQEAARPPNELRKAHLLTITAQGPAITSCRERQEVCLGAAACGSPTARVCPSVGAWRELRKQPPGVRGSGALPPPRASRIPDGRVGGNSGTPEGPSPAVPPAPRVRL